MTNINLWIIWNLFLSDIVESTLFPLIKLKSIHNKSLCTIYRIKNKYWYQVLAILPLTSKALTNCYIQKHQITSLKNTYLFKISNRNNRKKGKMCSKLTTQTPDWCNWRRSSVFNVNFEHVSYFLQSLYYWLWPGKYSLSACFLQGVSYYYTTFVTLFWARKARKAFRLLEPLNDNGQQLRNVSSKTCSENSGKT